MIDRSSMNRSFSLSLSLSLFLCLSIFLIVRSIFTVAIATRIHSSKRFDYQSDGRLVRRNIRYYGTSYHIRRFFDSIVPAFAAFKNDLTAVNLPFTLRLTLLLATGHAASFLKRATSYQRWTHASVRHVARASMTMIFVNCNEIVFPSRTRVWM